jgi:hypothetical protein
VAAPTYHALGAGTLHQHATGGGGAR